MNNALEQKVDASKEEWEKEELIKIFLYTVKHFFGAFEKLFEGVNDPREQNKIIYPLPSLAFAGILMFLCRLGSRRQLNEKFRCNYCSQENFSNIFEVEHLPHGDTLNYTFKKLNVHEFDGINSAMVEKLIRCKVLYPYRLFNYYLLAIDGTGMLSFTTRHCPHCLERHHRNGTITYYHHILEAKLVTPNGFAFSLMTEFIENPEQDCTVQDCELNAFYRLVPRIKERFPRLPICLLLDGLYAGGPTFTLCNANHWKYIITLKDKDLPSVNQEFSTLLSLLPENCLNLYVGPNHEVEQNFSWVTDIAYQDSFHCDHSLTVFQCLETQLNHDQEVITTKFKWLTNFQVNSFNIPILANKGGRLRWKIENEGFNIQKNGGFGLEHPYSTELTSAKIFYYLMQIAYTIFQLMEKGSLFIHSFPNGLGSLKNIAFRLLEAWRNFRLTSSKLFDMLNLRHQIRFNTS